ncbi:MAG: family transcriptional regulator [Bryobacterales bacterium]|nr:family transcriptional regulator [Bryobacterales bacterium]
MLCAEILRQVVELARHYVRTGRTTERRLAREAGVSQPHMHNVLKEVRHLSPESCDKILKALGLSVPDILWWYPGDPDPGTVLVPILRDRIGPGSHVDINVRRGYLVLPRAATGKLTDPVAARIAPDPALPMQFRANDLVVLDRSPVQMLSPPSGWCWVVAEPGGLRVRYVQQEKLALLFSGEPEAGAQYEWKPLCQPGQSPLEVIRGRIVWTSRELEATAPSREAGPARGRH